MRISDWSSDVCSSDLEKALQQAIAGREKMAAAQLDVKEDEAVRRFAEQVTREHPNLNVLINNAGIMRFERLNQARDLRDSEAERRFEETLVSLNELADRARAEQDGGRSEEHRSELQTLMRTANAV